MTVYRKCCLLLLVALLTKWSLGRVNSEKSGCGGDSIKLFQNIQVDSVYTVLTLDINGAGNTQIGMWVIQNFVLNSSFINIYRERLGLDQHGNIWIYELQNSDEGNYFIECKTRNNTTKDNINLSVLVAPETSCKPKIIRGVDTLTTYLESKGCGKPVASVYWLEQPGISVERNEIKLLPGQEAGTVYACIDGPALKCAKSSKLSDYCSVFEDENKIQSRLSHISGVTIATLVITTLYDNLYIVMIVIIYQRLMHMLNKIATSNDVSAEIPLLSRNGIPLEETGSVSDDTGVHTQTADTTGTS